MFSDSGFAALYRIRSRHSLFSATSITPEPVSGVRSLSSQRIMSVGSALSCDDCVPATPSKWSTWPQTNRGSDTLQFLQFHFEHAHVRHAEVDAVIAFFDLALLSDPLVFLSLKAAGRDKTLAFYESTVDTTAVATHPPSSASQLCHILLLSPATAAEFFLPGESRMLELDLAWLDLIHCG